MFDVEILTPLSIIGMDFLTSSNDDVDFEVRTKDGSHVGFENDPSAWNVISKGVIKGQGVNRFTSISDDMWLRPTRKDSNTTQAFHLSVSDQVLLYSTPYDEKDGLHSNDNILVRDGTAIVSASLYPNRVWNGALHYYAVKDGDSIQISSTTTLTLYGDGITELDLKSTALFENVTAQFLEEELLRNDPPITSCTVEIVGQEISNPEGGSSGDRKRVKDPSSGYRNLEGLPGSALSSIEIDLLITGEYIPPPEAKMDEAIDDSINKAPEMFIQRLKENVHVLKDVKEVGVVSVETTPRIAKEEECSGISCINPIILVLICGLGIFFVGITVLYTDKKRKVTLERRYSGSCL